MHTTAMTSAHDAPLSKVSSVPSNEADYQLEKMGYHPEMRRTRSTASVIFMCFVMASIPYGLSTTFYYSLANGGPATVVWGWVFLCLITVCVAISLAEICSAFPTSGGVYYQTYMLASSQYKVITSWICGWAFLVGNWTITLAVNFGTTSFLIASIAILDESFAPTTWQTYLIFLAITTICVLTSVLGNRWLPWLDTFAIFWTGAGLLATIVSVLALAKGGRRSGAFAFGEFDASISGWPPGWSWFVGLLQAAYATSSTGMVVSMCEEVAKPEIQVPRAMVWVVVVNGIAGLLFLVPLMFVLPDLADLLAIPSGQPLPYILKTATGSAGGAFGLLVPWLVLGIICGVGCTTAASRCTWAFSRDGAVPGFRLWRQVNEKLDLPLYAMGLSTAVQVLLGLIYFGSTAAFNAFSGVGVICLGLAYAIPILVNFTRGRRAVQNAPFNLGKIGYFCNIVAIAWFTLAIPLFCMPAVLPVTVQTMNYASVVFVGFSLISVAWFLIWGKSHYRGPPTGQIFFAEDGTYVPAPDELARSTSKDSHTRHGPGAPGLGVVDSKRE